MNRKSYYILIALFVGMFTHVQRNIASLSSELSTNNQIHRYKAWEAPAPGFNVKDIGGINISLDKYIGKWILLCFWTTKGSWSQEGFDFLKTVENKFGDNLVKINLNCYDSEKEWIDALETMNTSYSTIQVHINNKSSIIKDYNIIMFPTFVLINPEMNVVEKFIGIHNADFLRRLESLIY